MVTLVRGDQAFSFPATELDELVDVLTSLWEKEGEIEVVEEELDVTELVAAESVEAEVVEAVIVDEPVVAEEAPAESAAATPAAPRPARRGRMWKAVRAFLAEKDRARGYNSLLALVKKENLTDGDPDHALKILLGRKVNAGELALTPAGRYRLVAPQERQRGNVWASIKRHLGANPDGVAMEELVATALDEGWSQAKNPRQAITRALNRYAEHLATDEGLIRLA